jgi:hypothetical protein
MSRTITRLFDDYEDAERAVREIERLGVEPDAISLIAQNSDRRHDHRVHYTDETKAGKGAGEGAGIGAVVGGAGGLLTGLGMMAIPGVGPVVAAGWLAATAAGVIAGAVAGGALVGALTKAGVTEEDANVYAEGVRRGGVLVSAKVRDSQADMVAAALDEHQAVDARSRGVEYRQNGWNGFDERAPAWRDEDERRGY